MLYKSGSFWALLVLLAGFVWGQPLTVEDIAAKGLPSVVHIVSYSPPIPARVVFENGQIKIVTGSTSKVLAGFVISKYGHIVTAAHGIHSKVIFVGFYSRTGVYRARVVYLNEKIDMAILHAPDMPRDVPVLKFSTEDSITRGSTIVEIGHPEHMNWSVASGVVSNNLYRPWHIVQMTAPVHHGNSGGPILNDAGEVVGMALFARVGYGVGLGFGLAGDVMHTVTQPYRE
jgi:S1-C subfamily serine protease